MIIRVGVTLLCHKGSEGCVHPFSLCGEHKLLVFALRGLCAGSRRIAATTADPDIDSPSGLVRAVPRRALPTIPMYWAARPWARNTSLLMQFLLKKSNEMFESDTKNANNSFGFKRSQGEEMSQGTLSLRGLDVTSSSVIVSGI